VFDGHANHVWQGTTSLASAQAGEHCLLGANASFTALGTHGDGSAAFAGVTMPYSPADGAHRALLPMVRSHLKFSSSHVGRLREGI